MPLKNLRKTPGVYVEEISKFPPSIASVETAIPAFIGYTAKIEYQGEYFFNKPKRITSLQEYVRYFDFGPEERKEDGNGRETTIEVTLTGKPENFSIIPAFNGENKPKNIMFYAMQLFFANGGGPCYIVSVGTTGTAINNATAFKAGLDALKLEDEPTIIYFPEAVGTLTNRQYKLLIEAAMDLCKELMDRVTIMDVKTTTDPLADVTAFRGNITGTIERLKYGAAYYPYLKTVLNYEYLEGDVKVIDNRADPPADEGVALDSYKRSKDQLYNRIKAKLSEFYVELPPGAAVAGIYAQVDSDRGVWKAPANVPVSAVVEPLVKINDDKQDILNVDTAAGKSINALRTFVGKGTLVWGARTLAGNDNEWRYISVRRFFNFVEESVKKASFSFVFEPNNANTWVKVKAMIENFLIVQWRAGALVGSKPEHAFYVKVGLNETMSVQDILDGFMIVEIGMAVVRPAEFIILRFSHKMQES